MMTSGISVYTTDSFLDHASVGTWSIKPLHETNPGTDPDVSGLIHLSRVLSEIISHTYMYITTNETPDPRISHGEVL